MTTWRPVSSDLFTTMNCNRYYKNLVEKLEVFAKSAKKRVYGKKMLYLWGELVL